MHSTSLSLLQRLKQSETSTQAWVDFVEMYTPVVHTWVCRLGVPAKDAEDLMQELFLLLFKKLPDFQHNSEKKGAFRSWLRTLLVNKWREIKRRRSLPKTNATNAVDELVVADGTVEFSDEEYRRMLLQQALLMMKREFNEKTWRACWEHVILGKKAHTVALELETTPGAVRVSSSRVLRRLRELMVGLLD